MSGHDDEPLDDTTGVEPFPPADRKLITQPYDLSIQTLKEQWDSDLLILPEIQRAYVWDDTRASKLIESLLLNIPIPVLYLAETEEAKFEIIDGHQRIRSIARYLNNEFRLRGLQVLTDYNGLRYHQLPERESRFLRMRTLRAIIISFESGPLMKFEIFERLNSGSIALNAQELRNSMYRGSFNRLLHELANHNTFRELLGSKAPRKRMTDEELILRFFAMRSGIRTYRPPLKRFLNRYMLSVKDSNPRQVRSFRNTFDKTAMLLKGVLGDAAFRVTDRTGARTEKAVNRALFDAQMLAFSWIKDSARLPLAKVRKGLAQLFEDEDFEDSIRLATGDRTRTLKRVRATVSVLRDAGVDLGAPRLPAM